MLFSLILSASVVFASLAVSALLSAIVPHICWTPRIGGTLVGIAVFVQGYIFANRERFKKILKSGITLEQRLMQGVFVATIFGTLLWAYGDLAPKVLWIENCTMERN